ncbi:MAG: exonuclease subunit SbcD [Xanthomonadales bacterium]|jgi:exonuclease SbcD|nr:exonuclease subunit SbcD [Xanthomonadales bacterium]
MRLLHTADWHLGQSFHGHDRIAEHRAFLDWLIDLLDRRRIDALLIAGDIYDSANPPADAQALYYDFLRRAGKHCPGLQIVVIAGNHDSPARLEAPRPVLQALGVEVIGHYRPQGGDRLDRLAIPLSDRGGDVRAWVLALPYLRPADLASTRDGTRMAYTAAIGEVYAAAVRHAAALRQPGQALIGMGHLHVRGGALSADSERRLLIGGEEAVEASLFPAELAYVALGHLHLAQRVGAEHIRYSGSPLPMSYTETGYPHQVVEIELTGEQPSRIEAHRVPRSAALLRYPDPPRALGETLEALKALELPPTAAGLEPLLEVPVLRAHGDPEPAPAIRQALEGRAVRLTAVKAIRPHVAPTSTHRNHPAPRLSLDALKPLPLFEQLVERDTGAAPSTELLAAFGELLAQVQQR